MVAHGEGGSPMTTSDAETDLKLITTTSTTFLNCLETCSARYIKLLTRLHDIIDIYSSGVAPVIRSPEPLTSHTHFPTSHQCVESESDVPLPYEGSQPAVGIDVEWYTS